MKFALQFGGLCVLGIFAAGSFAAPRAAAQDPILTPIIVDTAVPIVVAAVKPKPKNTGLAKFEGYVMHANVAQRANFCAQSSRRRKNASDHRKRRLSIRR